MQMPILILMSLSVASSAERGLGTNFFFCTTGPVGNSEGMELGAAILIHRS